MYYSKNCVLLVKRNKRSYTMEKYYNYTFLVSHDGGQFFLTVRTYQNRQGAIQMIMDQEGCPKRAIEFVSKEPTILR